MAFSLGVEKGRIQLKVEGVYLVEAAHSFYSFMVILWKSSQPCAFMTHLIDWIFCIKQ